MFQRSSGMQVDPSKSKSDAWTDTVLPPHYLAWRQEEQRMLLEHIRSGDYVADFCCGDGRLIQSILAYAGVYDGCDIDAEAIARARLVSERFGDRVRSNQCDFMSFLPTRDGQLPNIALCLGNSLAAVPYELSDALGCMAKVCSREIFASVIRKGTLSIRKEYYEQLGVPYTCDEKNEIFDSVIWGESRAFGYDELATACERAGLSHVEIRPVGELGFAVCGLLQETFKDQR